MAKQVLDSGHTSLESIFEVLIKRHDPVVRTWIVRWINARRQFDIDDLSQSVWIKVLEHYQDKEVSLESFDLKLLYTITYCEFCNYYRSSLKRQERWHQLARNLNLDSVRRNGKSVLYSDVLIADDLVTQEQLDALEEALLILSGLDRKIVKLSFERKSQEQISKELGICLRTVGTRFRKAINQLANRIKQLMEYDCF